MGDWQQWRGPLRNGISTEQVGWRGGTPKRLWAVRIGEGYSAPSIKDGKVYSMGNVNGTDYVSCMDAVTGKVLWSVKYACEAGDYGGPRATPVIHNSRVYTMSREGQAFCLDAASGRTVWQRQLARDAGAETPDWGFSGSPLIHNNTVLYNIGGSGMAVDKNTGRTVWRSSGKAGYASPVPFDGGVAIFAGKGLVAVNPANGQRLWEFPWETSYDVNAADPIFSGGAVFISSNYGKGGALLRLGGGRPTPAYQTRMMKNHFNPCVLLGGMLYGNDEGRLRCIEWATGAGKWEMRGMGKGGLIAASNQLVIITESGELVLAQATPAKFTEIARARVHEGDCWTQPVLANGLLYIRNHQGMLVCLDLRK
jgi:outer membrane protein assembly factor BamB